MDDDERPEGAGCPCGKPRDRGEALIMLRAHAARGNLRFKAYDMCPEGGCEDLHKVEDMVEEAEEEAETEEAARVRRRMTSQQLVRAALGDDEEWEE